MSSNSLTNQFREMQPHQWYGVSVGQTGQPTAETGLTLDKQSSMNKSENNILNYVIHAIEVTYSDIPKTVNSAKNMALKLGIKLNETLTKTPSYTEEIVYKGFLEKHVYPVIVWGIKEAVSHFLHIKL